MFIVFVFCMVAILMAAAFMLGARLPRERLMGA